MKLLVGLDVSLKKICVIGELGQIVKEAQVAGEPEAPVRWICDQDGAISAVGLAAAPCRRGRVAGCRMRDQLSF